MPSAKGKTNPDPDTPGRAFKRLSLLDRLIEARRSADRNQADKVLIEANRWLRRYPFDMRVVKARDRLREVHPLDPEDTDMDVERRGDG
jgi:hypothetical protein